MDLKNFCADEFWNSTLTWHTDKPRLTRCCQQVALTIIPNLFILLLIPFEIINIKNSIYLKIDYNRYNVQRLLVCVICVLSNLTLLSRNFYETLYSSNLHTSSDLIALLSNTLAFIAIAVIFHFHRKKGVITSGISFFIVFLISLCSSIKFLDVILYGSMYQNQEKNNIYITTFFSICLFFICCLTDDPIKAGIKLNRNRSFRSTTLQNDDESSLLSDAEIEEENSEDSSENSSETNGNDSEIVDDQLSISPLEYSSFLSKLGYFWYAKLIRLASKREIKFNEIYESPQKIKADPEIKKFKRIYNEEVQKLSEFNFESICSRNCKFKEFDSISLLKVIGKTYWMKIILFIILKTLADIITFTTPLLLNVMISFVADANEEKWHLIPVVLAIIFTNFLKISLINLNNMEAFAVAINLKTCLSNLIFEKTFKLSPDAKNERSIGEWMNLFNDSGKFIDFAPFFVYIFSSPIQLTLGTLLLYYILGNAIFIFMFVVITVMMLQYVLNRYRDIYMCKQVKINDERMKLITQTLIGIRTIKISAYEEAFGNLITTERNKQANFSKKIYYLQLILDWIFSSLSPFLVFTSTISIYIFVADSELTPQKAFVAILTFKILSYPLEELPSLISSLITIRISLKRISEFLRKDELIDYVKTYRFDDNYAIIISKKANFAWTNKNYSLIKEKHPRLDFENIAGFHDMLIDRFGLQDLNSIESNSHVLKDIELEIEKKSLTVIIGKVGSGKSSLISAILGEMYLIKKKDKNGTNRLKGEVYISNDQDICYVGQQAWILNDSFKNNILFGQMYNQEQYEDVIRACALEPDLKQFEAGDETEVGEKGINLSGGQKQRVNLARACYSSLSKGNKNQLILLDDPLSAVDAHVGKHLCDQVLNSKTGILKGTTRILVTNQLNQLSDLDVDQIILLKDGKIELKCTYDDLLELEKTGQLADYDLILSQNDQSEKSSEKDKEINFPSEETIKFNDKTLIKREKMHKGRIDHKNYWIYLKYFGFLNFMLMIAFMVCENLFQVLARVYLATWTNNNANTNKETEKENLLNYVNLSCLEIFSSLIASIFMAFGVVNTIRLFHKNLLHKVLHSSIPNFFDVTQLGPILQRFSNDILIIDNALPESMQGFLSEFLKLSFIISLVIYKQPSSFIFFVAIVIVYYFVTKYYINASTQLKRHESITNSALSSFLTETFNGISTIKAYDKTFEFARSLRLKLEDNNRCKWYFSTGYRWLKSNLNLLANTAVIVISYQFLFNEESSNAGNAALLFSYTMSITDHLSFLVRYLGTFEANSVSLERINEYNQNEEEDDWVKENKPPYDWPENGTIEFIDYSGRYRKDTNLVLKDLNFKIEGSDKIGVVGRTGAGKSTITLSLFRIIEPALGKILIDNIDISKIGLHDLRSKLSIIPQDPVLFTGTIRFNLDPFDKYSDKEIYESLEHAHLKDYVNSLEDGIQHKISEGGENLSVGQRQLICLARALLRKSKILVLDEATASVDFSTDELVQKTIRSQFKDCTCITIAHRIQTILDSSKILLLEKGELKEFEKPEKLLEDQSSKFYALAAKANII